MKTKLRMVVALLAAWGCGGICWAAAEQLVVNGGFNEVKDGRTVGWNEVSRHYAYRDGMGRSGTRALCFENVDEPTYYNFPGQKLQLKAGKSYEYEVWIRTENLTGAEVGASICIEWTGADGKWLGGSYAGGVKGTSDWTCLKCITQEIPPGATSFTVHPYVRRGMLGKAWFDDVVVREYVPEPVQGLFSTAYRNLAADGEVTFKAALNLKPEQLPGLVAQFTVKDASGKESRLPGMFDHRQASLTLPVAALAKGTQTVGFEVARIADGKALGTASLTFTRADRLPSRKVWFDRQGRTIVNGQPFFPLGMYWSSIQPDLLKTYAKGPFNCLMPYSSPNSLELMDLCQTNGIKVIYSVKDVYFGSTWVPSSVKSEADEEVFIRDCVARFKDHPALLAWYLNDELPLTMIKRLSARRDLMERLDPDHPGWVVLYQYTQIRDYLSSFDVIGTDPYPIPLNPSLMATVWARSTRDGTMGCKPFWQVPQAFNWGVYKDNPEERAKVRAPTEEELRSMGWQAIANGANGLIFYSFFDLLKQRAVEAGEPFERRWAECCRVGEEIRRFIPVFLSVERAEEPPALELRDAAKVGATVSVRSWWKDGEAWVLVVNGGDEAVRASVRLRGKFRAATAAFGAAGELTTPDEVSVSLAPLRQTLLRLVP